MRTFAKMHYKVGLSGRYMPSFSNHSEIIIDKVIEIVEDCFEKFCTEREMGVPVTHNEIHKSCQGPNNYWIHC